MNEIVNFRGETNNVKAIRNGMAVKHNNLLDLSLYEEYAIDKKVPLHVLDGNTIDTQTGVYSTEIKGYYGLLNVKTDTVIQTKPVSETYKLVPHYNLFALQNNNIFDSSLRDKKMEIHDRLYEDGLKAHRTIYFPELKVDVKQGDSVMFRIDIFNSINMTWALQVFTGAYRSLCRNSCVFGGEKAYHGISKHTSGLSPESMIGKTVYSSDMFLEHKHTMDKWLHAPCSEQNFSQLLKETLCKNTDKYQHLKDKVKFNEKLHDHLLDNFRSELNSGNGHTLWSGYNALTSWSTHTEEQRGRKNQNVHEVRRKRENQVRNVLDSELWIDLENASRLVN